ncbi:MAG: glycosyltransferase family 2 protein [Sphingobacterium sp.]
MRNIKHSIIVLTYNQAELLPQCLDSILQEEILPFEIIIGDDCSTDETDHIVAQYKSKYPEIIKMHKNEKNLGIFKNWNRLMKLANGEIISSIAGDDFFKPGLLKSLNSCIHSNNLDAFEEKFIVVTNSIVLHTNGQERIYDNYKLRNTRILKARIRYGLSYREVGISRRLFDSLDSIEEGIGFHADWLYIIDQVYKSDKFYFINEAFSVYRLGSGVTSSAKAKELYASKLEVIKHIRKRYSNALDEKDLLFLEYWEVRHKYLLKKTLANYLALVFLQFKNIGNFTPNNSFFLNFKLLISGPLRALVRIKK